jgi:hypothetical protein
MNKRESKALWQTILGVIEVIAVDVLMVVLLLAFASKFSDLGFAAMTFGLTQLLYVIPRGIYLYRQKNWPRFKGVVIGAVIAALLNGGCWLLIFRMLSNTHY